MSSNEHPTLTIHVAAPGTPFITGGTSMTGHMFLSLKRDSASEVESYGFGPDEVVDGKVIGKVTGGDVGSYVDPYYARTMQITEDQYNKIREYAGDVERYGFNKEYDAFTNGCTDFTWGALNHAGLHARIGPIPLEHHEGAMRPLKNVPAIQSIDAPFPDSPLNKETRNPMPERNWKQWLLSDNDRAMMDQVTKGVAALDASHGRAFDETSERMCGSLLCLAKQNGLTRVDHVLLSQANEQGHVGTTVFVVQGAPSDPAHLRAGMPTAVAAQTPVEASMAQLERIMPSQQQTAAQEQMQVQEQQASVQRMG